MRPSVKWIQFTEFIACYNFLYYKKSTPPLSLECFNYKSTTVLIFLTQDITLLISHRILYFI